MNVNDTVKPFAELGDILQNRYDKDYINQKSSQTQEKIQYFNTLIAESHLYNPWFTKKNVDYAVDSIAYMLQKDKLEKWLSKYHEALQKNHKPKTIGIVMAGNIPMVGFHDYLCTLITGNIALAKLSSQDNKLLPALHEILSIIAPGLKENAVFTKERIKGAEAFIATGSNNTSRYFEYYFGKYPHIIRKNRTSVAVLTGNETQVELEAIADDIFMYFGLGCRNITKLFIPVNYNFEPLFQAFEKYKNIIHHNKYANNYEYYKSIFLVNTEHHLDNGFVLLKEIQAFSSPVSTVYYEYYQDINEINKLLQNYKENIQCIVSSTGKIKNALPLGKSQQPELWDYADGIDTVEFLLSV